MVSLLCWCLLFLWKMVRVDFSERCLTLHKKQTRSINCNLAHFLILKKCTQLLYKEFKQETYFIKWWNPNYTVGTTQGPIFFLCFFPHKEDVQICQSVWMSHKLVLLSTCVLWLWDKRTSEKKNPKPRGYVLHNLKKKLKVVRKHRYKQSLDYNDKRSLLKSSHNGSVTTSLYKLLSGIYFVGVLTCFPHRVFCCPTCGQRLGHTGFSEHFFTC